MKNRLLALMLSSLVLPNVAMAAQEAQCPTLQAEHLKAQYQVTNGKGQQWQMTLIRNGQDFIIQRDGSTFEQWSSNGEYVRYFPAEKRSVTYRKGDLRALNIQHDRDQLYHVVSPALPTHMTKTQAKQEACFTTQGFEGKVNGLESELVWIDAIGLPAEFILGQSQPNLAYKLVGVEPFASDAFVVLTQDYQDIDFADVGDSESDPFIAKMINQGFIEHGSSGFYNSEGQAIEAQGGHGSHSH
ncbi:hypothetical protein AYJ58_05915 [Shewanella sp. Pdp11]|uniref:hypothetical protein n=1 Tax=Shewanella sp. Pdp11 TaxID=2059264 RepID=UPI000CA33873|nr:hypothetical protein [Shewanella sp. Pdp11]AUD59052.1 hypothetical protein AYJ58_05915 [Shewanella sp. Pdp11]